MLKKIKNNSIVKAVRGVFKVIKFYINYLNQISFTNTSNSREIIIIFDGKLPHGGLVDRLKGIVSFYQIAKTINITFKIYYTNPFDLESFLVPNHYNWMATKSDLKWHPFKTKTMFFMDDFVSNPLDIIQKSNKKKFFVYSNCDYQKTIFNTNDAAVLDKKWHDAYHELFKMSDYLKSNYDALQLDANRLGVHTRFTSILGDFKDTTTREVSDERKEQIISNLKQKIDTIIEENIGKSVYVFSDSITFLTKIVGYKNCKITAGVPNHIDINNSENDKLEAHIKTFLDFYAIAHCEKVYLLQEKDMYNSAFSKYAAIVGNSEFIKR